MGENYYVHIESDGYVDRYLEFESVKLAVSFLTQLLEAPAKELKGLRFSLIPQDSIYLAVNDADDMVEH